MGRMSERGPGMELQGFYVISEGKTGIRLIRTDNSEEHFVELNSGDFYFFDELTSGDIAAGYYREKRRNGPGPVRTVSLEHQKDLEDCRRITIRFRLIANDRKPEPSWAESAADRINISDDLLTGLDEVEPFDGEVADYIGVKGIHVGSISEHRLREIMYGYKAVHAMIKKALGRFSRDVNTFAPNGDALELVQLIGKMKKLKKDVEDVQEELREVLLANNKEHALRRDAKCPTQRRKYVHGEAGFLDLLYDLLNGELQHVNEVLRKLENQGGKSSDTKKFAAVDMTGKEAARLVKDLMTSDAMPKLKDLLKPPEESDMSLEEQAQFQNEVVENFLLGYLEEYEGGASSAGPSSSASASSRPSPSSLSDYKFRSSRELQVALQRYFQVSHGVGKEFASAIGVTHAIDARLAGITGKGNFKRIPLEQIEKAAYLKRRQGVSARREL